jgi:hypothetical protein
MSSTDVRRQHSVLELFVEDSWRRVHAGELEMRRPGAPTTQRGRSPRALERGLECFRVRNR